MMDGRSAIAFLTGCYLVSVLGHVGVWIQSQAGPIGFANYNTAASCGASGRVNVNRAGISRFRATTSNPCDVAARTISSGLDSPAGYFHSRRA